jgi:hypothetical protein
MSGYRRIQFKNPPPWTRGYSSRAGLLGFGDNGEDMTMSDGGGDFPPVGDLTSFFDTSGDSTAVSEVTVTAASPPVTVSPWEPLLSPPIELSPPTPLYNPLTDPSWTWSPASPVFTPLATNPLAKIIQGLLPKKPGQGGGGAGAGSISPPKASTPTAKPATAAASGLMVNPELAAGLALAGLVFAAALLAGHHDRRGGSSRGRGRR